MDRMDSLRLPPPAYTVGSSRTSTSSISANSSDQANAGRQWGAEPTTSAEYAARSALIIELQERHIRAVEADLEAAHGAQLQAVGFGSASASAVRVGRKSRSGTRSGRVSCGYLFWLLIVVGIVGMTAWYWYEV